MTGWQAEAEVLTMVLNLTGTRANLPNRMDLFAAALQCLQGRIEEALSQEVSHGFY